MYSIVTAYS
jgi:hypothetical protein